MRRVIQAKRFEKSMKRMYRRGLDCGKVENVVLRLREGVTLPAELRDHALRGKWIGFRECHVEPNWLLVYRLTDDELFLADTGTHSDLFGC